MFKMQATCAFCKHIFDMELEGPIDRVECPRCMTRFEIMMMNTTSPETNTLAVRILKEGEKKYDRRG